jgi:light-regulated signal transduction histidine kinase (bacteriophytochrome)
VLVTIQDISDKKRAEQQFRSYAQRRERRTRELEEFAAATADEVRDPLCKIGELARNAEAGGGANARVADLARMAALSDQSIRFVDDLLLLARWSYGNESDTLIDLNGVVAETLQEVALPLQSIAADIHADALPTVHGHAGRFRLLFRILFGTCDSIPATRCAAGNPDSLRTQCVGVAAGTPRGLCRQRGRVRR